ncbi:tripartite tricarboxylate transporter substrate binding protein [Pararhodobacter zhoushanensis]|uniref:Tripartite tricarboxylate transporter substrate binding protein n=1 Tax=Pararhodobacter zhoushanensis TaxID=2479545 RepID=A0ABT3H5C2_9RHOB|nr:tripartite tricarboxylate transporter substrate binding protein [Pararhodobacter zhoushanensis]MCW1934918.1 tripartite tricarboxylate transporter substrate binding protein [Pararhodobacter zhoushanensis]
MTTSTILNRRLFLSLSAAVAVAALPHVSSAQTVWPTGTVQLLVPARAGGGTDAAARVLAGALQERTGQSFVVVNNPGGGGVVAAETVRAAAPDGQTLLFFHSGIFSMYHTGTYDHSPLDEFTTAAELAVGSSYSLAVSADSPYQTTADLVAASIAAPNSISLGVQLRGSTHFMAGLLVMDSDAQFRIVDAGSDADKLVQLQGHQIDAALVNTSGALQYVETGDLRILGTIGGSPDRDAATPDIPSLVEQGYERVVYGLDFLIMGPAGMDPAVVSAINAAINGTVEDPEVSAQLATMNFPLTAIAADDIPARLQSIDASVSATAELLGLN